MALLNRSNTSQVVMQVHLSALGCRLNEAELQNWANSFQRLGLSLTSEADTADLIVLNTCAVTAEAARKSRQTVRRFHRANPQARKVVTGCYASLEPEEVAQIMGVDLVVANEDKDILVEKAKQLLEIPAMPEFATEPGEVLYLHAIANVHSLKFRMVAVIAVPIAL